MRHDQQLIKTINMDMENLNMNTLDGPEWLRWAVQIQAMAGILDCWDVFKGEADGASLPDFLLLVKPSGTIIMNATLLVEALSAWNKRV